MENTITEIIARRQFVPAYIWLDIGFLILLAGLLLCCLRATWPWSSTISDKRSQANAYAFPGSWP